MMPIRTFLGLALLAVSAMSPLSAQTTQATFGKNRVQYHKKFDNWLYYETANFVTYWYGDARNVAQATLQIAELDYNEVQQLLEHQLTEKVEVLVFSDLTDLKQSNIGEDEVFQIRSGETKVVGNKIFVYFDGDHRHLRNQVREGFAGVVLNSMLYGSNLQEIVQNAVLLNLPGWYTEGLTAYCGQDWSPEMDNQLREHILSGRYKQFDKLARENPRLAGHAFWFYISQHFGKGTVSNLLYLTRINRSIDAGFLYVLGSGYRRTSESLIEYFTKRYTEEAKVTRPPDKAGQYTPKNKKKAPQYQAKLSPDGQRLAWVSNDIGRWRVWVQDVKTGKRRCIMKTGVRNALQATDYNYPLLAWHPDNQRLAVLYERRDVASIALIDVKTRKKEQDILSPEYQRVFSFDYINGNDILLSAAVRGYSDLFIYHSSTRQSERITQDFWDDLDAAVVNIEGHKGIMFVSNRPGDTLSQERLDTILPLNHFDVFYYDLEKRGNELVRITQTPFFSERFPQGIDSTYYTYLSDENGIFNRQAGYLEPYIAYYKKIIYIRDGAEASALDMEQKGEWPLEQALAVLPPLDTVLKNIDSTRIDSIRSFAIYKKRPLNHNHSNYDRNIREQHVSARTKKLVEGLYRNGKYHFYVRDINPAAVAPVRVTRYRELTLRAAGIPIPPQPDIEEQTEIPGGDSGLWTDAHTIRKDTAKTVQPGWLFQVPDYLAVPGQRNPERPKKNTEPVRETPPASDSLTLANQQQPRKTGFEWGKYESIVRFYTPNIVPYRLRFRTDYISTTMDNNLLFEGLDSYAGSPDGFRTPPPGILLRANFKDLLEDYVVEAGFRLPTTFNGAEYYLWFNNKKRRLDKRMALYRKTIVNTLDPTGSGFNPPVQVRTNTLLGQYEVRYPLDVFTSLRATASLRQDRSDSLTTDDRTLNAPPLNEQRAGLRLWAVYDNTIEIDMNVRSGTRAKVFVEGIKRFEINPQDDWRFRLNKGFMTVVGLDARHYQMLDRRTVLAMRLAGATTFGSEKILYYLGGVDNWIFPRFNNSIALPEGNDFAFQTLAANLRGFDQNIRNGNSYALFNAELRVPIFKYFSRKPVMSNFWRNFQVVGFFDAGTAWTGSNPFRGNNSINSDVEVAGPDNNPFVIMNINYFRDPLVSSYGVGVRALIFGMYLRADYGWGIETRQVQRPLLHIALGTDF